MMAGPCPLAAVHLCGEVRREQHLTGILLPMAPAALPQVGLGRPEALPETPG